MKLSVLLLAVGIDGAAVPKPDPSQVKFDPSINENLMLLAEKINGKYAEISLHDASMIGMKNVSLVHLSAHCHTLTLTRSPTSATDHE